MTDKNRFSLLGKMNTQDQDATVGPIGTPGAGAGNGKKKDDE
jgi:hypothetical protein